MHHKCRFVRDREYDNRPGFHRDAYQFHQLPDGWRAGFEIKVSRADLIGDLKQQWKQQPLARLCNELYLVYPRGLLRSYRTSEGSVMIPPVERTVTELHDLPWGMGAIEVYRDDRPQWRGSLRAKIVKIARYNMSPDMPVWFLNRLLLHRNRSHSAYQ